ncbi:MAG: L,D-transpeptidase, partial [Christensenellaceae bacterium]|nr:L,D-transpeptidase [Christensenellaceae bacterium]
MKRIGAAILAAALLLALCGAGGAEQILLVDADVQTITLYEGGQKVKSWPCAVGKRGTPSPLGVWAVTQKHKNWGTGFGTRWIGFACPWGNFGIHG